MYCRAMIFNIGPFLALFVHWLLVTDTLSQSYTRSYNGYVFTLPGVRVYWANNNAQAWCSQNGSRLLEIKSSYIQNLTIQFLNEIGVQFADGTLLITNGLRTDRSSWNWVHGQGINGITITGQGQDLAKSFGYINNDPSRLYISADIPTEVRGYICQVAGKLDCANGFSHNKLCYESYNSPTVSWFDARNRCLNEGGDLASFDFINDNNELNSTLKGSWLSSSLTYWVGIRRQWWTWQLSNLEANYTNWLNGRPGYRLDSPCLCLYKSGGDWKWIERDCNSVLQFVCLTEPPATPYASTSTVTTTTIIDTATLSGSRNPLVIYSNPTTKEPPLSISSSLGGTENRTKIGIGIGVGSGGALIIAALIVVVFVFIRKRGCLRKTTSSPDVTLHEIGSHYAEIPKSPGYNNGSPPDANSNQLTSPVIYSDLEIFTGSPTSEGKDSVCLISSKTATIPPPNTHKGTTHFPVDGLEYAEVKDVGM